MGREIPTARLGAVLAVLEATPPPAPEREPVADGEALPAAVRRWSGPLATLRWRRVAPMIRLATVGLPGAEQRTFLVELGSAAALPRHDHTGVERAVMLQGGFTDEHSHYGVGDGSWHNDEGHRVVIDSGGPCIALFVTDGPFALGSVLATMLVDWWLGTRP